MCSHSAEGGMGLIINKPAEDLKFGDLLKQLQIAHVDEGLDPGIYIGGPVEPGRGFVLHSSDYEMNKSTLAITELFGMTATVDVLKDISSGDGPGKRIVAMGYSGWGPGQLEGEIAGNGWLICDATSELVFDGEDQLKWSAALATLGVDPLLLSAEGGRA